MDPVALIVTALAVGAGSLVQDETSEAVKNAYAGLRDAVRQRLARQPDGEQALAGYEADPRAGQAPLARELAQAGAGDDMDLVVAAVALMDLAGRAGKLAGRAGKNVVSVSGPQGVQVGDHTIQVNNYFPQESVSRQEARTADGKPAGRLLVGVTDPFVLEVHRPVQADGPSPGLSALPTYVPREHDRQLAEVAQAAAEGTSGIAVLVGGSSTGKTRACWEALGPIREQPEQWRVWHPIDPSRLEAALRELPSIGPRTVVWLNEAQFYLDAPAGGLGERVAAGLRELLRNPDRGPVLVLATLWPSFWNSLTTRPMAGSDPHAQARELLAGHDIVVPDSFTAEQLLELDQAGDVRLSLAASEAVDGQVIQFLAGAPKLLDRYRTAPRAAREMIHAAMDACRLGMGPALPLAFLQAATAGYLTDREWDQQADDWVEQALAYIGADCHGVRGPVTRIRPRTVAGAAPGPDAGPVYRLADYLDQQGRLIRKEKIPPAAFWSAVACAADSGELTTLGDAARNRGLFRDAALLYRRAVTLGDPTAAERLLSLMVGVLPGDHRAARWIAAHAPLISPAAAVTLLEALQKADTVGPAGTIARRAAVRTGVDDPYAVAMLLSLLQRAGATGPLGTIARRTATRTPVDDPGAVAVLLNTLWKVGAVGPFGTIAHRAAVRTGVDDPYAVAMLLNTLRRAGAADQIDTIAPRVASDAPLGDANGVSMLLDALRKAGAAEPTKLLERRAAESPSGRERDAALALDNTVRIYYLGSNLPDPADVPLRDAGSVSLLLEKLRKVGDSSHLAALLARDPAGKVQLDDAAGVGLLLRALREVGASDQITALLDRNPAGHVSLDGATLGVAVLINELRDAGAADQAFVLASRATVCTRFDDHYAVRTLLDALGRAGATDPLQTFAARTAAHIAVEELDSVALVLDTMRDAGAGSQARILASRAAAHGPVVNPAAVALLLDALRGLGAADEIITLANRAALHTPLDNPNPVAMLLSRMHNADTSAQAATLISRLPASGMFQLFLDQKDHREHFRFGRETDGTPSPQWDWDELG